MNRTKQTKRNTQKLDPSPFSEPSTFSLSTIPRAQFRCHKRHLKLDTPRGSSFVRPHEERKRKHRKAPEQYCGWLRPFLELVSFLGHRGESMNGTPSGHAKSICFSHHRNGKETITFAGMYVGDIESVSHPSTVWRGLKRSLQIGNGFPLLALS